MPDPLTMPQDKNKVSSETQSLMDIFITNGMEIIYDEKTADSMLPRISASEEPVKVIAEILVDIVLRLVKEAQTAGMKIPPEIVLHGSNFLLAEIFKVLEAAGMEPMTDEQKTGVWQMATSIYLDQAVQSGQMTEQELMTLSQQVKQTEEGQKVMQTVENPEEAVNNLEPPQQSVDPNALAAPQGGI